MSVPFIQRDVIHSYIDGIAILRAPKQKYQLGELVILSPRDQMDPVLGGYVRGEFELGEISAVQGGRVLITVLGDETKISANNWVYSLPHFFTQSSWFPATLYNLKRRKSIFSNLTLQMKEVHLYSVMDPLGRKLKELTAE